MCPLLSQTQRTPAAVESDVKALLLQYDHDNSNSSEGSSILASRGDDAEAGSDRRMRVLGVPRVTVHYVDTAVLCVEVNW